MTQKFLVKGKYDAKNNIQIMLKLIQLKLQIGKKHEFGCQFKEDLNNRNVTDGNNINGKKFTS